MKFTFLATVVTAAAGAVSGVSATCYGTGETWGNQDVALNAIRHLCDTFFPGTYGPSGSVSTYRDKCINGNSK
ncbi:hypothetical protein C7999DRAFT_35028 [Corynascus novoguineensis]|uniref:Uncharacterized protein n=1 Tax=Corynascus novoguineensis TaxID=1126955 RepID=A0AAN7CMP9_9PEZI|nr:hypothetical protein C7999DRAFT_35028 [Corynascus novoguineensis]